MSTQSTPVSGDESVYSDTTAAAVSVTNDIQQPEKQENANKIDLNRIDLNCFHLYTFDEVKARVKQLNGKDKKDRPSHFWDAEVELELGGWLKWIPQAGAIGSNLFNAVLIYYNFATRPARDSRIPYNLTSLILIYAEFSFQLLVLLMAISKLNMTRKRLEGSNALNAASPYYARANWLLALSQSSDLFSINALTYLPMARPGVLWKMLQRLYQAQIKNMRGNLIKEDDSDIQSRRIRGCLYYCYFFPLMMIIIIAIVSFYVALGIGSIVLKLSQVAFVGTSTVSNWAGSEWLLLIGFLNNIVALTDHDSVTKRMMVETVATPMEWKGNLMKTPFIDLDEFVVMQLIEHYGSWRAILWWRAMSAEEARALLIAEPELPSHVKEAIAAAKAHAEAEKENKASESKKSFALDPATTNSDRSSATVHPLPLNEVISIKDEESRQFPA